MVRKASIRSIAGLSAFEASKRLAWSLRGYFGGSRLRFISCKFSNGLAHLRGSEPLTSALGGHIRSDIAFIASFNGKFSEECLRARWFMSLEDAHEKLEPRRREYNEVSRTTASGTMS